MFAPEIARSEDLQRVTTVRFNEAGACLPRKYGRRLVELRAEAASMRPGHVCPGNHWPIRAGAEEAVRFNEAGACLPRKSCTVARTLRLATSFNEAGACLPRKCGRPGGRRDWSAELQ